VWLSLTLGLLCMPLGKHNTVKLSPPAPSWRPTGEVSSAFCPCSHTPTPENVVHPFCAFASQACCLRRFGSKVVNQFKILDDVKIHKCNHNCDGVPLFSKEYYSLISCTWSCFQCHCTLFHSRNKSTGIGLHKRHSITHVSSFLFFPWDEPTNWNLFVMHYLIKSSYNKYTLLGQLLQDIPR